MTAVPKVDRRQFLLGLAGGSAGLMIGCAHAADLPAGVPRAGAFDAWLRIGSDDSVTVLVSQSEMGQGVTTSLPMLVAEELGCDWSRIKVEMAPADPLYRNVFVVKEMLTGGAHLEEGSLIDKVLTKVAAVAGQQVTGGSTSIRGHFTRLRRTGASARELLIAAAATEWQVSPGDCVARDGKVLHPASARSASFGSLAERAAALKPPEEIRLKSPKDWSLLGKPTKRLDSAIKTDGRAIFGTDVRLPDMLHGVIQLSPVFGGKLQRADADKVRGMPGVKAVVPLEAAVVVVADTTWQAMAAMAALPVAWNDGDGARFSSKAYATDLLRSLSAKGDKAEAKGEIDPAFAAAAKTVEADYEVPFLAHATLEPMNCTARVGKDLVEIWAPTQAQETALWAAADAAGVSRSKVRVHTTYLGGGFGRRAEFDFVAPTVKAAAAVGRPVQLLWPRDEDMRHDFYRPAAASRIRAGLDKAGMPTAWHQKIASASIMKRVFPPTTWLDVDQTLVEGAVRMPYAIPHRRIEAIVKDCPVPVGFWRSVGHSYTAFMKECFVDELAAAAGKDPLAYRLAMLAGDPRSRAVLSLAAEKADWGKPLPPRQGRGLALHASFGAIVAEVAEVSVAADGSVEVKRVVCAVDCGIVINPSTVVAQMQSGVVFGLTAALDGRIDVIGGRVVQGNFDDYPMLRLGETPPIEVHILPSTAAPGGVGEPSTPPIAPAVVNAVAAATGKRVRALPLADRKDLLKA
jgi:isoquinoline 1-oxidoreductase beta subunit